ncbi:MAG: STAS domain-containing protein [Treponema sp.]|jgi:anti-anti-sigma factor|nr:STAS domain-containing protein [Treponema sp.]
MTINKTHENEKITFGLERRLDTTTAPQLQDVLLPALDEAQHVELDFSKLDYVSSAGLRVLLMGHKAAIAKGKSMTLCGVSEEIMEVFEMTGYTDILSITGMFGGNTHV